jgi:hypothetical protein
MQAGKKANHFQVLLVWFCEEEKKIIIDHTSSSCKAAKVYKVWTSSSSA